MDTKTSNPVNEMPQNVIIAFQQIEKENSRIRQSESRRKISLIDLADSIRELAPIWFFETLDIIQDTQIKTKIFSSTEPDYLFKNFISEIFLMKPGKSRIYKFGLIVETPLGNNFDIKGKDIPKSVISQLNNDTKWIFQKFGIDIEFQPYLGYMLSYEGYLSIKFSKNP